MITAVLVLLVGIIVIAALFRGEHRGGHGVTLDLRTPIVPTNKIPDPTIPTGHVIDMGETWAVCSCGKWSAGFPVRGPLPMWARGHLMNVRSTPVDDNGVTPQ